jgi:hypothetical protein
VAADGLNLGPVGGRIVAETLIGLLRADPTSYLSVYPQFRPFLGMDLIAGAKPNPTITASRTYTRANSCTTPVSSALGSTVRMFDPLLGFVWGAGCGGAENPWSVRVCGRLIGHNGTRTRLRPSPWRFKCPMITYSITVGRPSSVSRLTHSRGGLFVVRA